MYKILLVDDDRIVRFDFKRFKKWKESGFCIADEAEDGYEALGKIESQKFDVALVDIKMPRIDGLGLLSALKEKGIDLCVIIVSGHSDFEYARQGFKLGAFDYLIKPVNEEKLVSLLESVKKHLDALTEQKRLLSETRKNIEQSLRLPYSPADEDALFAAIVDHPGDTLEAAQNLADKITQFYGNDPFRIATLLRSSYENITKRLLDRMPYLFQICDKESLAGYPCRGEDESSLITSWYVNGLSNLARSIRDYNLNSSDSVVRLFCEYLLNNLSKDISLDRAAREIGYSSKYISTVFKEKTGESCVAYITRLKMRYAASLLLTGKYKNYEISEMLGYKKPDYFCRLFKNQYGVTPSEYKTADKRR